MNEHPKGPPPSSHGFNPENMECSLKIGSEFGQYRIVRLLGVGGMGEVYEVEHRVLETRHALKLINESIMLNQVALSYFKKEGRVMAQLHHPGIVLVDEFGETDGRFWLRMELMSGVEATGGSLITLEDYVWYMGGKLTEEEVCECMRQFLGAIGFAHNRGIVHRDLKPTNILLHPTGMKIADFGLVKMAGESWHQDRLRSSVSSDLELEDAAKVIKARSGPRTADRAIVGTYEYMSPEQKKGDNIDARSDLFAVGLICFQILTGEETPSFKKPSELNPGIGPEWDDWLEKALAKDSEDRFQSAEEMKQALPPTASKNVKAQKPPEKATRTPTVELITAKKTTWASYAIVGGALAAVALLATTIVRLTRPDKQLEINGGASKQPSQPELNSNPANPAIGPEVARSEPNADTIFLKNQELQQKFDDARSALMEEIKSVEASYKTKELVASFLPPSTAVAPRLAGPSPDPGFRTWADATGFTFVATLNQVQDDQLVMKDNNGSIAHLEKKSLRTEDRAYVDRWLKTYIPIEEVPFVVHSAGIPMRWIPKGTVTLGSDNPPAHFPEESPKTQVSITQGFWIGQFEITQQQLKDILGINPSQFSDNPDHPAEKVIWGKASDFCTEINRLEQSAGRLPGNWTYRLPTEAQWQHACGADEENLSRSNWYSANSGGTTRRVGLLQANTNGLFDMQGNVKEWVHDVFARYPGGSQKDWFNESGGLNHILRGGSWKSPARHCRPNARFKPRRDYEGSDAGFRLALVFEKKPKPEPL